MTKRNFTYLFTLTMILAGVVLILCGMDPWRAVYLILFGVFYLLSRISDFQNKETPKGWCFWLRKVLANIVSACMLLSFCNFFLSNCTAGLQGVVIWISMSIAAGIIFGTFDYFAHCYDEEEFQARIQQQKELGDIYDKVVEEMNSEKK